VRRIRWLLLREIVIKFLLMQELLGVLLRPEGIATVFSQLIQQSLLVLVLRNWKAVWC